MGRAQRTPSFRPRPLMGFAALYPSYRALDGQISIFCQAQIFSCPHRANQWHFSSRLTRQEGRLAIVTKRAVGCGGRGCAFDERHRGGRRSRVVLPLPNKNNALGLSNGILRSLMHLGFFPVCLTIRNDRNGLAEVRLSLARPARCPVALRSPGLRAALRRALG
jgi:hypothetical protein